MGYDVLLAADGDLPRVARMGTGLAEIAQRITIRLRTMAREWVLDTSVGVPYQAWKQQKPRGRETRDDLIRAWGSVLQAEILATPGVVTIDRWEGTFDVAERKATYTGYVRTDSGELQIQISPERPSGGNQSPHLNIIILQAAPIVGAVG